MRLKAQESLGAASPGSKRGPVWHLCTVASKACGMFRPLRMWALGGDANLASWLHPTRAKAPRQSQSTKHALVLSLGNFPSLARRESAQEAVLGFDLQPQQCKRRYHMSDG